MKKRILPALLALCMVMSLLPVAFAADPQTSTHPNSIGIPAESRVQDDEANTITVIAHDASLANKHTCNLDGCTCITKTVKTEKETISETEYTKTTTTYSYALCSVCQNSASCNPCTGKAGCATKGDHQLTCPESCNMAVGGVKGCTKKAGHAGAHNSSTCTKDANCGASTHDDGCVQKCYYCNKTKGATTITVDAATKYLCDTCAKDATKNPCGFGNCSLPAGHASAHNNTTCPENVEKKAGKACGAKTHLESCADRCKVLDSANAVDITTGANADPQPESGIKCTLSAGHSTHHNNTVCVKADKCGAGAHFAGTPAKPAVGNVGDEGYQAPVAAVPGCPSADTTTNPVCGVGGCTRPAKHEGDHANPKCLGYNDDKHCGAAEHIAGCSKYVECTCGTHAYSASGTDGSWSNVAFVSPGACTGKLDCAHCAAWNTFVTERKEAYDAEKAVWDALDATEQGKGTAPVAFNLEYCSCVACGASKTNPGMGAVVDANGNPVDPTDPAEPNIPTKAEDFTDMEDWMAADVQVALDKGWLQGNGDGTFNGRGVTTGTTIAAVLARMDGETITGSTWAQDALAWAEDKDVFEGVELTGESMARKDLVLVLWRMADKPGSEHELDFTDVEGLEGDHLTAMKWAVENGIVKGNGDGTVTPDGAVNRAALCAMLARYDGLKK